MTDSYMLMFSLVSDYLEDKFFSVATLLHKYFHLAFQKATYYSQKNLSNISIIPLV